MIVINGHLVAQGSQFSLSDVEVVTATVDLDAVRAHRATSSRSTQAAGSERYERIRVDWEMDPSSGMGATGWGVAREETRPIEVRYHSPEEEIALSPSLAHAHARTSPADGVTVQSRPRVLALGLPSPLSHARLLRSS